MDSEDKKRLRNLLYDENKENLKTEIIKLDNSLLLHIIAANYNWDSGFEIPSLIINNSTCDLGTALMMFYNADGYRILESGTNDLSDANVHWKLFITDLYNKIKSNDFKSQSISYTPQINKVQIFKLKKNNPDIPNIFLERSPGIDTDIPVL
jgi:hypothetical protein